MNAVYRKGQAAWLNSSKSGQMRIHQRAVLEIMASRSESYREEMTSCINEASSPNLLAHQSHLTILTTNRSPKTLLISIMPTRSRVWKQLCPNSWKMNLAKIKWLCTQVQSCQCSKQARAQPVQSLWWRESVWVISWCKRLANHSRSTQVSISQFHRPTAARNQQLITLTACLLPPLSTY